MDESDRWLKNIGRQSSVKDRWPHNGDKPSDPSKSSHSLRSGSRRESGSDSQDGTKQEQSYHHTKSKTSELYSDGVSTGIKVVPAHMRTTQSTTRPKTTPCVQEIPQPTPINVTPTPPSWEQPRSYPGKHLTTQSQAYTSSGQRSVKEHITLTPHGESLKCALPWSPCEPWSGQDKEPEEVEVKKQTKAGGGQRSHHGVKYYQKRSEEKSPIAGETVGIDKGKVKPPGGAKRAPGNKQQGNGAELDDGWQVVDEKELQATGEEVDKSWRDMVDELEEENRKLSRDVGGFRQDKYFMEKSMRALKEQLEVKEEEFDSENRQLTEQIKKLSVSNTELTTVVNTLQTQVKGLVGDKEALQNEVQVVKTEIETFAKETEEWRNACNAERCRREGLERRITELEKENDWLRRDNSYEFWNVPRSEVYLNMQKFLGTGAWGFVVEGTFRGQQVAVKCLHDVIRSPKFAEVMRKEIAIMAQVRHPNLVLLIAAVIDTKKDPLIVTELLETSLRKAYEENLLQNSSKLNIFRDIAAALNYLHLHHCGEIIHRDVSSANVLLEAKPNSQWKAKLSDFGSAKLAIEAKTTAPGAPVYSAPEVRKEMRIPQTAKLDVYSYGILLCEVTVEQFPDKESLPSMMQEVQDKWAFLHRLINSCIQNRPDRRPTMSYILSELNKQ